MVQRKVNVVVVVVVVDSRDSSVTDSRIFRAGKAVEFKTQV